jgi:hypothetical protein
LKTGGQLKRNKQKAAAVIIIILLGQNLNKLSFKVFEKIKNKYLEQHSTFSRKAQCSTALAWQGGQKKIYIQSKQEESWGRKRK